MLSLKDLQQNLAEQKKSIFKIPLVVQYNKRDLSEQGIPIMPVDHMEKNLNSKLKVPAFQASALNGTGVAATLKECLARTLRYLQNDLNWAD